MASQPVCEERSRGQVDEQYSYLLGEVDRLESFIDRLENRLSSVLRSEESISSDKLCAPDTNIVPFADAIRSTTRRVQSSVNNLIGIVERIEL